MCVSVCVCGHLRMSHLCMSCFCVFCVNIEGPNRKILLDMLCSVGVQRCHPPSLNSPTPNFKPTAIGNSTIPPSARPALLFYPYLMKVSWEPLMIYLI